MDDRTFPILMDARELRQWPDAPRSIPWALIAPHAQQCQRNHYQTPERLAQRGGLCPIELGAVLRDELYPFGGTSREAKMPAAIAFIRTLLTEAARQPSPASP